MRESWEIEAIHPSWEVFAACERCGVLAGMACRDLRGTPKGWYPNRGLGCPALRNPHRGRKKIKK